MAQSIERRPRWRSALRCCEGALKLCKVVGGAIRRRVSETEEVVEYSTASSVLLDDGQRVTLVGIAAAEEVAQTLAGKYGGE